MTTKKKRLFGANNEDGPAGVATATVDDAEPQDGEESRSSVPVPPKNSGPPEVKGFSGAALRQRRESQGIELKEVAARTRINAALLLAVEEERWEDLPNARIYVRGYVRCLSQEIGLDPDLVEKIYLKRWETWAENQKDRNGKVRLPFR